MTAIFNSKVSTTKIFLRDVTLVSANFSSLLPLAQSCLTLTAHGRSLYAPVTPSFILSHPSIHPLFQCPLFLWLIFILPGWRILLFGGDVNVDHTQQVCRSHPTNMSITPNKYYSVPQPNQICYLVCIQRPGRGRLQSRSGSIPPFICNLP